MSDHNVIQALAAELCHRSGGDWKRKGTKRALWMRRALALSVLADRSRSKDAAMVEAQKIMRGGR